MWDFHRSISDFFVSHAIHNFEPCFSRITWRRSEKRNPLEVFHPVSTGHHLEPPFGRPRLAPPLCLVRHKLSPSALYLLINLQTGHERQPHNKGHVEYCNWHVGYIRARIKRGRVWGNVVRDIDSLVKTRRRTLWRWNEKVEHDWGEAIPARIRR